jgi:hypothetical protein
MKTILLSLSILVLSSCNGYYKKYDRGEIKEKFITSTKYGEPEYHLITENHVYEVTGDEYAQNQIGEHYMENIYTIE